MELPLHLFFVPSLADWLPHAVEDLKAAARGVAPKGIWSTLYHGAENLPASDVRYECTRGQ